MSEFTIARSHYTLSNTQAPTACILFGKDNFERETRFGLMSSRAAVSTLESRIKVSRAQCIEPSSKTEVLELISEDISEMILQKRLDSNQSVIVLPTDASAHLVNKLAENESNHAAMRMVSASLSSPKHFRNIAAVQQDAVQTALRAFGLSTDDQAVSVELVKGQETALARLNIMEDSAIEHDARYVPGYELVGSDITGRAVFEKGLNGLEVYTANRRPLEKVFGVDLIYLNTTHQNIVMLQYKMLEPSMQKGSRNDWIYRPDASLESEMKRMRRFKDRHAPGKYEYRLNPEICYLKFVKRDGALRNAAITMPIEHFERLLEDPKCQGPRGGFRISFESLEGRYLRQSPFLDLIRSGYIGAHAETTDQLRVLIRAVASGNKAVVAAIQYQK